MVYASRKGKEGLPYVKCKKSQRKVARRGELLAGVDPYQGGERGRSQASSAEAFLQTLEGGEKISCLT